MSTVVFLVQQNQRLAAQPVDLFDGYLMGWGWPALQKTALKFAGAICYVVCMALPPAMQAAKEAYAKAAATGDLDAMREAVKAELRALAPLLASLQTKPHTTKITRL